MLGIYIARDIFIFRLINKVFDANECLRMRHRFHIQPAKQYTTAGREYSLATVFSFSIILWAII